MKNQGRNAIVSLVSTIVTIVIIALLLLDIGVMIESEQETFFVVLYISLAIISLFTYGLIQVSLWKSRHSKTVEFVNSINSIDSLQEEVFKVGSIMYDEEGSIIFVTPWIQKSGFDGLLGKNIESLGIDLKETGSLTIVRGSHKWEATIAPKSRTVLIKDKTKVETLKEIIDSQLKAVISFHTSFSKKISLNGSTKADATLKINQTIKDWVVKHGGLLNATLSTEGTVTAFFNWRRGEKEVYSQYILEQVKQANAKMEKEITISIGVSFGDDDYSDLLEKSLKSLEISKNRGGDEIVLSNPDGELEYIGVSKKQAVSGSKLDIKNFHSEFIEDISKARDIYITSHKMADLDAIGSALGVMQLVLGLKSDVWIVLEQFDQTASKFYESLPKRLKDQIISEKEAIKKSTASAHFIITDTSNPISTQAEHLLEQAPVDKVTIIDHHRMNKGLFEYLESKTLIETAKSSASEIVVEMLRISLGDEARSELDPFVATGLLSGIKLDSKQLSKNVTNSTFESVAWLMSNEANTTEVEVLFRPSQNLIKIESEAFANIKKPSKGVIFTFLNETTVVPDEDISILADKLLTYDGIDATYVLGKTDNGRYKLSARSNGEVNVQHITEKLGGGGHFNVAAASWPGSTKYDTIKNKVLKLLG